MMDGNLNMVSLRMLYEITFKLCVYGIHETKINFMLRLSSISKVYYYIYIYVNIQKSENKKKKGIQATSGPKHFT